MLKVYLVLAFCALVCGCTALRPAAASRAEAEPASLDQPYADHSSDTAAVDSSVAPSVEAGAILQQDVVKPDSASRDLLGLGALLLFYLLLPMAAAAALCC
jgi:hypothetical protein